MVKNWIHQTWIEWILSHMTTNQGSNIDPLGQLENYDVNDRLTELRNLDIDESFIDGITYDKY